MCSTISKLGSKGNSWSDSGPQPTSTTSELWGAPVNKAPRGPPPGLGANKSAAVNPSGGSSANGWIGSGLARTGNTGNTNNWSSNTNGSWNSTWLFLKNLTAQVQIFVFLSFFFTVIFLIF